MAKSDNPGARTESSGTVAERPNLSPDFLQALRDINRNRVLLLMLAPRPLHSNTVEISPIRAAILALLWEFEAQQKGPVRKRVKASGIGQLLGLNPNGVSAQIVPMSDAGLCKELSREAGQDKRVSYYIITDQGKRELNRFLDRQYRLADGIYQGASMERVLNVLELIRGEVGSRVKQLLQQIIP